MIKRLLLALVMLLPLWASADTLALRKVTANFTGTNVDYTDPQVWCDAYVAKTWGSSYWCYTPTGSATNVQTSVSKASSPYTYTWYGHYCVKQQYGTACGSNFSASPAPYCADGQAPYRGVVANGQDSGEYYCLSTPPPCTDKNPFIRKFYYTTGGPYGAPDHYANCKIMPLEMLVCRTDSTGTYCMWKVQRTGDQWTGTDTPGAGNTASETPEVKTDTQTKSPSFKNPSSDPKICPNCIPCPTGSVQAGVDSSGVPLCIGTGTAPPDPPKAPPTTTGPTTTKTNADGSTTATQTVTQTNSDGSTTATTTNTTTASDGTVTVNKTVTVSNTPSGASGRTDTPSTDQNNLCKQNPNLTICMNSSVSGTCGTITCSGDAIQCATLRATALMQCQEQQIQDDAKASTQYSLGSAAAAGADPAASTLPSASKADVVTMATPDNSGWLGAGSYFKDKTIDLGDGHSLVLPLSQGSDVMIALRYVTMIVCSLVSFRIIRGTFSSSGV